MKEKNDPPKFIVVYHCGICNKESGFSDQDEPICQYCDADSQMTLVSKEPITPELIAARLKASTDNMMRALRGAYESMPDADLTFGKDEDPEKFMLHLLAKVQKLKDDIQSLDLRSSEEE